MEFTLENTIPGKFVNFIFEAFLMPCAYSELPSNTNATAHSGPDSYNVDNDESLQCIAPIDSAPLTSSQQKLYCE